MDEKKINYIENIEHIFGKLADMNLTKANRAAVANMLEVMAVNGYIAAESKNYADRADFTNDIMFYAREAAK